jgi:hypothetical protein
MLLVRSDGLLMVALERGAPVRSVLDVASKHELVALMHEQSGQSCFSSMSQNRPSDMETESGPADPRALAEVHGTALRVVANNDLVLGGGTRRLTSAPSTE